MKKRWIALIILTAVIAGIGFGAALNYREAKANNSREAALSAEKQEYQRRIDEEEAIKAEEERKRVEFTTANLTKFTNDERVKYGLQPVAENILLDRSAQAKCEHMVKYNYWEHVAPDGTQPWYFITAQGYSYSRAGENLGYGWPNSERLLEGSTTADATYTFPTTTGSWLPFNISAYNSASTTRLARVRITGITATAGAYFFVDDLYDAGTGNKVAGLDLWYQGKPSPVIAAIDTSAIPAQTWGYSDQTTSPNTMGADQTTTRKFVTYLRNIFS